MKWLKRLWIYIKHHDEINHNYWYAIKEGYCQDETYNWLERTIHINYGFIYPMYFGFLSGFIGVMMFAVDSLFPPPGGPPITFYSNFFALGWTGYTSWIDLTSLIP